jgi:hypothetical protein
MYFLLRIGYRSVFLVLFPAPLVDLLLGQSKLLRDFSFILFSPVPIALFISLHQYFYLEYALTRFPL